MTKPTGSLCPAKFELLETRLSVPTQRTLGSIWKRWASLARTAAVNSWSGEMSAMKMPRPWVATMRSFSRGWTLRSWTGWVGMLLFILNQLLPPSIETWTPNSVPTNRRAGLLTSSRMTLTGPSARPPAKEVQVCP